MTSIINCDYKKKNGSSKANFHLKIFPSFYLELKKLLLHMPPVCSFSQEAWAIKNQKNTIQQHGKCGVEWYQSGWYTDELTSVTKWP
jgi:hypothetical protein